ASQLSAGMFGLTEKTVVADALLFDPTGSLVAEETVAVLVMFPLNTGPVEKVEVMVADCPEFRVPRLQGYAVVHAPLFETNDIDAGVGSLITTLVAADGPLFVTVTV